MPCERNFGECQPKEGETVIEVLSGPDVKHPPPHYEPILYYHFNSYTLGERACCGVCGKVDCPNANSIGVKAQAFFAELPRDGVRYVDRRKGSR